MRMIVPVRNLLFGFQGLDLVCIGNIYNQTSCCVIDVNYAD